MKNVVIIRDRGQFTIPDAIRKTLNWVSPMSAVTISIVKPDEIMIKPHQVRINKEKIWDLVKASRTLKSKGKGSAAEFLGQDRYSH